MSKDTIKDRRFGKGMVMMSRALADHIDEIGVQGLGVYWAIAYHADPQGENAFPSLKTIAAKSGLGLTTVNKALAKLVELGIIKRIHRSSKQGRTSNLYELTPDHEWLQSSGELSSNRLQSSGELSSNIFSREFGRVATMNNIINKNNTTCTDVHTHPEQQGQLTLSENLPLFTNTQDPEAGIVTNSATTNVVGSNGRPHPPTPRPKAQADPQAAAAKNPAYQECFKVFNDLKQEHEGVPGKKVIINGKETGQNINKWLAAGYTAEELATVFVALKGEEWRTNALNMATIVKEGPNILRRQQHGKGKPSNGPERIDRDLFFSNFKTGDLYE